MGNDIYRVVDLRRLTTINEANLQTIKRFLDAKKDPSIVWSALNNSMKDNEQVQALVFGYVDENCIKTFTKNSKYRQALFEYIREENQELLKYCISQNCFLGWENLKSVLSENPQLASLITNKLSIDKKELLLSSVPTIIPYARRTEFILNEETIGRERLGDTAFWKRDGQAVQHFSLGPIQFQGREDYLRVVDKYIAEDMPIFQFCKKYHIDEVDGFKEVVSVVESEEKDRGKRIKKIKADKQMMYQNAMQDLIPQVLNGDKTIAECIAQVSWKKLRAWDFINAKPYISKEDYDQLIRKMSIEIGLFDKSFNSTVKDEYGVEYPQLGRFSYETLINWFAYDRDKAHNVTVGLKKVYVPTQYEKTEVFPGCELSSSKRMRNMKAFEDYEKRMADSDFIEMYSFKTGNGDYTHPTQENVNDAKSYLTATGKWICTINMRCVMGAIASGVLTKETIAKVQEEYEQRKKEEKQAKDSIRKRFAGITDIDEYFRVADEIYQEQKSQIASSGIEQKQYTILPDNIQHALGLAGKGVSLPESTDEDRGFIE